MDKILVDLSCNIFMCAAGTQYCIPTACCIGKWIIIYRYFVPTEHSKRILLKDIIDSEVLLVCIKHL